MWLLGLEQCRPPVLGTQRKEPGFGQTFWRDEVFFTPGRWYALQGLFTQAVPPSGERLQLTTPRLSHNYLQQRFSFEIEEFWAVALNASRMPLRAECLFRGSVDSCPFHPRDVFRFACRNNASALIVAHNHPSGDVTPSIQDESVNQQLLAASVILEVPIVDHLIVSGNRYFSFLQAGRMQLCDPRFIGLDWQSGPSLG